MDYFLDIDWHTLLVPTHSVLEMIVRGTIMYLALFLLLRFLARRLTGTLGTADVLVIVIIADAAQNGMAHDYASVTEGIVLVLTIVAWDFLIDWLSYHVPPLRRLLEQQPLPLMRNGKFLVRNMRKEMVTHDEMFAQLREHGVESPDDVKLAQLEEDGHLSVITKNGRGKDKRGK